MYLFACDLAVEARDADQAFLIIVGTSYVICAHSDLSEIPARVTTQMTLEGVERPLDEGVGDTKE